MKDAEDLLQFQDFAPAATVALPEQTHTFTKFPTSQVDLDMDGDEDEGAESSAATAESAADGPSMWSLAFYQRLFDVDSSQVRQRLLASFMPRPQSDFLTAHVRQPAPDLYGPLWVCVTLVLAIGVMANVADYLQSGGQTGRWRYDFRKVSISATAVFGYALLVPLLLWLLLLYWRRRHGQDVQLGFVEIVCLYGYSLAVYIPVSMLWTIPVAWLQWALVTAAAALSGAVLVLALWSPLSRGRGKSVAGLVLSLVLVAHLALAAGLQLYFFRYDHQLAANGSGTPATTVLPVVQGHAHATDHAPLAALSQVLEPQLVASTKLVDAEKPALNSTSTLTSTPSPTPSTNATVKVEIPPQTPGTSAQAARQTSGTQAAAATTRAHSVKLGTGESAATPTEPQPSLAKAAN